MKAITMTLIVISALVLIFFTAQAFVSKSTRNIEMREYQVLEKFDGFELREYVAANYSAVTIPNDSYKESSSRGFRSLAGYIFGGNSDNAKIAMTSPVAMEMNDSITMKFMIPSEYDMDDLPTPNSSSIRFEEDPGKTVAAISFGGWANDKRIEEYSAELDRLLAEQGIKHSGEFTYLGYNPPYEVVNRRNEVTVEVYLTQTSDI